MYSSYYQVLFVIRPSITEIDVLYLGLAIVVS